MDFSIVQEKNGIADISWEKPTTIFNLLWFSINIVRGTIFNNPTFGLDLSDIKKLTDDKIEIITARYQAALKWIIDIGKARSIDVIVEKNTQSIGRIDILVSAIQADGTPVELSTFRSVGSI